MWRRFFERYFLKCFFLTFFSVALVGFTAYTLFKIFSYTTPRYSYVTEIIELPNTQILTKVATDIANEKNFPYALPKAPNEALTENSYSGFLPKIDDGLTPYRFYAAPFNTQAYRGVIAAALGPFELDDINIYPKIDKIPHPISLIFSPYTKNLQDVINYARQRGHEVYLTVPLESLTFPVQDPGPDTLMINYSKQINLKQLNTVMGKATGYVGLINLDGGRFVSYEDQMRFFLKTFEKRGIAFIDGSSNLRSLTTSLAEQTEALAARVKEDNIFTNILDPENLQISLNKLGGFAKYNKIAIGIFNASPMTIDTIKAWDEAKPVEISFAPLSVSFLPKIIEDQNSVLNQ